MTRLLNDKVVLLGYPVDRLPKEALEQALLELIEAYFADRKPKYATSITALFLGQLSGITLNRKIIPQVTETLRQADFIGVDSKELQVLMKLLGNSIDSLITPEYLLLASASLLAKHEQSLFLLGLKEETCRKTAAALSEDFPGLKIAGIAAPQIYTKDLELADSIRGDSVIIEMINDAKPTILALHLGHPKQEVWLERILKHIKVPLIIGIGGGFDRYLERKNNTAAISDLSFFFKRFRRNWLSFFRYCLWIPPLVVYNTINKFLYDVIFKRFKKNLTQQQLFLSNTESIFVVPLPPFVNRHTWDRHWGWLEEALEHQHLVIDFRSVKHINPAGIGLLYHIFKRLKKENKNLVFMGVSGDVELLLKLHGAYDFIALAFLDGPDEVLDKIAKGSEFLSISQLENQTTIGFFGVINREGLHTEGVQIEPVIKGRDLIVDLSYCTSITNTGFGFLLDLRSFQNKQKQRLAIANASSSVKNQFKYFQLNSYFNFISK